MQNAVRNYSSSSTNVLGIKRFFPAEILQRGTRISKMASYGVMVNRLLLWLSTIAPDQDGDQRSQYFHMLFGKTAYAGKQTAVTRIGLSIARRTSTRSFQPWSPTTGYMPSAYKWCIAYAHLTIGQKRKLSKNPETTPLVVMGGDYNV